jgi:hypothetical protein
MMTAQGPGHIAFSADEPGETLAVPLAPGRVAVQSVFERPEGSGSVRRSSGATTRYW